MATPPKIHMPHICHLFFTIEFRDMKNVQDFDTKRSNVDMEKKHFPEPKQQLLDMFIYSEGIFIILDRIFCIYDSAFMINL